MNHCYLLIFLNLWCVTIFYIIWFVFFFCLWSLSLFISVFVSSPYFHISDNDTVTICILRPRFHLHVFCFFFFFLPAFVDFGGQILLLWTVYALFTHCAYTIHVLKNIKNGSHDTIYTFKNYFATVFSVFSFQFQQQ